MTPGAANLYIYYRVRAAHVSQLIAAVRVQQAQWQSELPGLVCTLSRRADDDARDPTLMETYLHPQGLSVEWQHKIEAAMARRIARWIEGARHIERFLPCA